jgi:L-alanine-DL-glutamate epimerase-like enolase superfamily enzyme
VVHDHPPWVVRADDRLQSVGRLPQCAHGGVGNLHVLGAMVSPGLYYERGLLHPFIDYDTPPAWLNTLVDPMDDEGNVHISPEPGLGYDINWEYIDSHLVD